MASIQKITLSALRDIPFNKLVLTQSNVPGLRAGDGGRPGLRSHHQTAQSPGGRAVAGIVTRAGYALPPSAYPQRSLMLIVARRRTRFTRARSASLHST